MRVPQANVQDVIRVSNLVLLRMQDDDKKVIPLPDLPCSSSSGSFADLHEIMSVQLADKLMAQLRPEGLPEFLQTFKSRPFGCCKTTLNTDFASCVQ